MVVLVTIVGLLPSAESASDPSRWPGWKSTLGTTPVSHSAPTPLPGKMSGPLLVGRHVDSVKSEGAVLVGSERVSVVEAVAILGKQ